MARQARLGHVLLGRRGEAGPCVAGTGGSEAAGAGSGPREMGQRGEARPLGKTGQQLGQQARIEGKEEKSFSFSFSNFHPNFECKFKSF